MQYATGMRRGALAMVTASAATLLMTACQPGGSGTGAASSPSGVPAKPAASKSSAPTSAPSGPATTAPSTPAGTPTSTPATKTKTCGVADLEASMYQAAVRPDGTGTGAAIVEFTNVSAKPCTVQGHPTVAGAGNGSPAKNHPLTVTAEGSASTVVVAPGGKAWTKLTFVQVQGEADGYCASGSTPVTYPTLVVGLPAAGFHQVALDDGVLAECDDTVTVTAVSATKPS
ncbi:DUF4232 domain-containing protein [Streptomyces sp. NBC_00589]|nr:DUF4232 domain-containing protein [Streptomyces sp. NBC_00775]WUB24631.1 DUF4232 domain-containing protein [Streptomyces sp. NBC_00589]